MNTTNGAGSKSWPSVKVWDPGVRFFHWLLVASVSGALATGFFAGKPWLDLHVIFGVIVASLIVFRLVWGAFGSTYARFGSFMVSPATALRHLRGLPSGGQPSWLGHNPLGAWMIVALLIVLTVVCATGVVTLGGVVKEGPLAPATTYTTGREAKEIHEFLAFLLLGLIAFHIAGAIFESWRTGENLPRAMITGRKRLQPGTRTVEPVRARPIAAAVLFAGVASASAYAIAHYSALPAYRTPAGPLDPVYVKECGACHTPHHPSLAPARTWRAIMAGLGAHFGENASLDPDTTARLTAWLTANAAENWDTRAANVLRTPSTEQPLRITAVRSWLRIHRDIPDAVFTSKAIGGRLNCANCHRDADSGRFAPRAIAIRKDAAR